jgi:predicted AAA+ superfamily ATPase
MSIKRALADILRSDILNSKKVIVLYGARQVGKTTLVNSILSGLNLATLVVNSDQSQYIDILSSRNLEKMKALVAGYDLLFIDEAQRIPDIGINLKILADEISQLKIIATGSFSFELANKVSEPLTGRSWTHTLYPLSFFEFMDLFTPYKLETLLEQVLIYGLYPEVFTTENMHQKERLLSELERSYLYKDALDIMYIKYSSKIKDLLKLLAFQIGNEVSVQELCSNLGLSREAVERYINILEKSFVLFRLSGFSRNLRKEVSKMDKIYFWDLGVRNAVIDNFKPLKDRMDTGQLFENFLISERKKLLSYKQVSAESYYWRTHTGAELDYVEDRGGELFGFEFKWSKNKTNPPLSWVKTYKGAHFTVTTKNNFSRFTNTL